MAKWDQEKIMFALVQRGEKLSNLEIADVYVQLYNQKPNVATLFTHSSPFTKNGEWHIQLREGHKNFDASIISGKETFLKAAGTNRDFNKYTVTDWDAFANKLGLCFGTKDEEE